MKCIELNLSGMIAVFKFYSDYLKRLYVDLVVSDHVSMVRSIPRCMEK